MKESITLWLVLFASFFAWSELYADTKLINDRLACIHELRSDRVAIHFPEIEFIESLDILSPRSEEKLSRIALLLLNATPQDVVLTGSTPRVTKVANYLMKEGVPERWLHFRTEAQRAPAFNAPRDTRVHISTTPCN